MAPQQGERKRARSTPQPDQATANPVEATRARDILGELISRAGWGKERIVITIRGKPLVALVPISDLELLPDAAAGVAR